MPFHDPHLSFMTFQARKMKLENSMTFQVFHDLYEPCCLIVFFDREQFNRHLFTLFNYCCLSVIAIVLSSAVTYLSHKTLLHDFQGPTIKFHDFPGLENEILKFHDIPGFPWPVQTLRGGVWILQHPMWKSKSDNPIRENSIMHTWLRNPNMSLSRSSSWSILNQTLIAPASDIFTFIVQMIKIIERKIENSFLGSK